MSGWTPPRDRAGTRERRRIGLPVPRDGRCAVTRPPAGNAGRRAGLTRARPATAPTASGPPAAKWTASVARVWVRLDPESAGSTRGGGGRDGGSSSVDTQKATCGRRGDVGRPRSGTRQSGCEQRYPARFASRFDGRFSEVVTRATACSVGQTASSNRREPASEGERHGRRRVRQRRCARRSGSLNRISKCFCVFANPSVPCHDHDQRRWLVNKLRCRQVHGVERANWLDRKTVYGRERELRL